MNPLYQKFQEITDRKLHKALRFMYDGLKEFDADPAFTVCMAHYGYSRGGVCVGCAATCAIQKAFEIRYTLADIDQVQGRGSALAKVVPDMETEFCGELYSLETAYNMMRYGKAVRLCNILEIPSPWGHFPLNMTGDEWRVDMPNLLDIIEKLEADGI